MKEIIAPPPDVKHVPTLTLENGIAFHSWVIGLPFFTVRTSEQERSTEQPETPTSVN
jgi:hypothetical protein